MITAVGEGELAAIVHRNMAGVLRAISTLDARGADPARPQIIISDHEGEWGVYAAPLDEVVEAARANEDDAFADRYAAAVAACGRNERRILVARGGRLAHCRVRVDLVAQGGAA